MLIPRVLTLLMAINSVRVPASKGEGAPFVSLDGGTSLEFRCAPLLVFTPIDGILLGELWLWPFASTLQISKPNSIFITCGKKQTRSRLMFVFGHGSGAPIKAPQIHYGKNF
jgi:hypothetical protein